MGMFSAGDADRAANVPTASVRVGTDAPVACLGTNVLERIDGARTDVVGSDIAAAAAIAAKRLDTTAGFNGSVAPAELLPVD